MGIFNKKTILLELSKLTYKCGEEVTGTMKFDFAEDKIKADKITIGLNRIISSTSINLDNGDNISKNNRYNFLLETNLMGKGEYSKEEIPFKFIIPLNAIGDEISFDKILNKIPKALRSIAEILLDMFMPSMRKKYSFEIIARIDIPWAIDITEKVAINITNDEDAKTSSTIDNEKRRDNKEEMPNDFFN
ncbi:MAG: hypothetical protein Q9M94_04790 [Candidatus Gracilibacteria bacterium]|nr:hypothetical protein [Candidatus Gracilibacteria bacterium]MDQ7022133.1 hypothetical protein [Candidatus Gracilibacteria bacterium]